MGWGNCGTDSMGRRIGYLHRGKCDQPGCKTRIERSLAYTCGGMHGTSDGGCEGYFCEKHLHMVEDPNAELFQDILCEVCKNEHNARLVEDLMDELKELHEEQAMTPLTTAQLDPIRETILPTVEDWLRDYGQQWDKSHQQLVNRVVAAIYAMHQCGVITINNKAEGPEGGV